MLECESTGGIGGAATQASTPTRDTGNQMTLRAMYLTAARIGARPARLTTGGLGLGGTANLGAADGSTLTVGGDTDVDAIGLGGYGSMSAALASAAWRVSQPEELAAASLT